MKPVIPSALAGIRDAADHLIGLLTLAATGPPSPGPGLGERLDTQARVLASRAGGHLDGYFDRCDFTALGDHNANATLNWCTRLLERDARRGCTRATTLADTYQETRGLGSKQAQGAFFTPPQLGTAMARMTLGDQPPAGLFIEDPACGAGALLICALDHISEKAGPAVTASTTLLGVELDARTAQIARACMLLAGAHADQFHIFTGDALHQPICGHDRNGTLRHLDAHVVLANPPFGATSLRRAGETVTPLVVPAHVLHRRILVSDHPAFAAAIADQRLIADERAPRAA